MKDSENIQDEGETVDLVVWEEWVECLTQKSQIVDFVVASDGGISKEQLDK
jgi:hypothetical protein